MTIFTLLCSPPSELPENPTEDQIAAVVDTLQAADCDLDTLEEAPAGDYGSFTVQRQAVVVADSIWVASDPDKIQAAGAVVSLETLQPGPEPTAAAETHRHEPGPGSEAATTTTVPSTTAETPRAAVP